jgi:hypothetical protein
MASISRKLEALLCKTFGFIINPGRADRSGYAGGNR